MPRKKNRDTNRFYAQLGTAIRLARLAAGKSQKETAEEIGVTFQQIQKYENGTNRISIEQLIALADYFEVSLLSLLSLSDRQREIASLAESLEANSVHALLESWADIDDVLRGPALSWLRSAAALQRRCR